jgi:hypothetical protein
MAKKIRCPGCGAKNSSDERRCRICGAVVNAEVAETPQAVSAGLVGGGGEARPPTDDQLRAQGYDVKARHMSDVPEVVAPDEHFDPNALEVPWTAAPPPPPPTRDQPVVADFEPFDPNALEVGPPQDPRPT